MPSDLSSRARFTGGGCPLLSAFIKDPPGKLNWLNDDISQLTHLTKELDEKVYLIVIKTCLNN